MGSEDEVHASIIEARRGQRYAHLWKREGEDVSNNHENLGELMNHR